VAVVGASGFAGFAVVEHLSGKGIETVPLVGSLAIPPSASNSAKASLPHLMKRSRSTG
jgi:nucleoside-diphosphate-sugar epimerase